MSQNKTFQEAKEPLSQLAEMVYFYAMDSIDEIVPFEQKTDVEKAEIQEIVALAIETSLFLTEKFSQEKFLQMKKLKEAYHLFENEEFDQLDEMLLDGLEDLEE